MLIDMIDNIDIIDKRMTENDHRNEFYVFFKYIIDKLTYVTARQI